MEKTRLTQRMWAKVTAFILLMVFITATVLSGIAAAAMISLGVYYQDIEAVKDVQIYRGRSPGWRETLYTYDDIGEIGLRDLCDRYLMCYVKIENVTKNKTIIEYGEENHDYRMESDSFNCDIYSDNGGLDYSQGDIIKVTRHYDFSPEKLKTNITLYTVDKAIDAAYAMKFWIYPIIGLCLVINVVLFVFLMCSSGRRAGYEGVKMGWGTKVPFDLLLALAASAVIYIIHFALDSWRWSYYNELLQILSILFGIITIPVIVVGLCMSFALRVKLGGWWKNTVIYYVFVLIVRMIRAIGRMAALLGRMIMKLPLIWKSALIIFGITIVEFTFIALNLYEADNIMVFWIIEKLILIPALLYVALCLRKLQNGGKEIAEGKSYYHFDTKYMVGDFKEHGENLNKIREGINIAVDERIKSERMKTELITNVSHDIKTPLTSIINYSALIAKEPTDNENIAEYSVVLLRQSERLKRLIDDLVEASKASTGNLEIIPAPFDIGVLFTQTAGEYEARLAEKELTLVTKQPVEAITIMADGRRMWRIFDNLMNNICKYAQGGTRVYLTLERQGRNAVISFKNTSRDELNMSADELMERFTRGDSSRNTDGNGLGLSIAKSLAELQGGTLELTVDGDLFKVVLTFPAI